MKVGDLVRWIYDGDMGIVINVDKPHADAQGDAYIHWFNEPELSGTYRISHRYLELVE
tara:strand:- start:237 stop:410 length:174 start_codon:yes stop_codon:yes gene_type:complete